MAFTASSFMLMLEDTDYGQATTATLASTKSSSSKRNASKSRRSSLASEASVDKSVKRGFLKRLSTDRRSSATISIQSSNEDKHIAARVSASSSNATSTFSQTSNSPPRTSISQRPLSRGDSERGNSVISNSSAQEKVHSRLSPSAPTRAAPETPKSSDTTSDPPPSNAATPTPASTVSVSAPLRSVPFPGSHEVRIEPKGKGKSVDHTHISSMDGWSAAVLADDSHNSIPHLTVGDLRKCIAVNLDLLVKPVLTLIIGDRILNNDKRSVHKSLARWPDKLLICLVPTRHLRTLTDTHLASYRTSRKALDKVPKSALATFSIVLADDDSITLARLTLQSPFWEERLAKAASSRIPFSLPGMRFMASNDIETPAKNPLTRVETGVKSIFTKAQSGFTFVFECLGQPTDEESVCWVAKCPYRDLRDGTLTMDHILEHVKMHYKGATHIERIRILRRYSDFDLTALRSEHSASFVNLEVVITDVVRIHSAQDTQIVRFPGSTLSATSSRSDLQTINQIQDRIRVAIQEKYNLPNGGLAQVYHGTADGITEMGQSLHFVDGLTSDKVNELRTIFPAALRIQNPDVSPRDQKDELELDLPRAKPSVTSQCSAELQGDSDVIVQTTEQDLSVGRECTVCGDIVPESDFPAQITEQCKHGISTCNDCIQQWIATELDSKSWDHIRCPQCPVLLGYGEIQRLALKATFERYDSLATLSFLSQDPDFHHCLSPICKSGQIHPNAEAQPIMTCNACKFRTCVFHSIPYHEGETCEAYTERTSGRVIREQNAESEAWLRQHSKSCPGKNCGWAIEKNDGCDHMTCKKCRYEFCWICLADYQSIREGGNAFHERSCSHWRTQGKPNNREAVIRAAASARRAPTSSTTTASTVFGSRVSYPPRVTYASVMPPIPAHRRPDTPPPATAATPSQTAYETIVMRETAIHERIARIRRLLAEGREELEGIARDSPAAQEIPSLRDQIAEDGRRMVALGLREESVMSRPRPQRPARVTPVGYTMPEGSARRTQ